MMTDSKENDKQKKTSNRDDVVKIQVQEFGSKYSGGSADQDKDKDKDHNRDRDIVVAADSDDTHSSQTHSSQIHSTLTLTPSVNGPSVGNRTGSLIIGAANPIPLSFMGQVSSDEPFDEDEYIRKTLRHFPWYWGLVLSATVNSVLKYHRAFVVRRSFDTSNNKVFLLTYRQKETIYHREIIRKSSGWTSPQLFATNDKLPTSNVAPTPTIFPHIHLLIDAWSLKFPNGIVPISRPTSTIFHDDLKMTKVLGKGAFGDVRQAKLTMSNGDVKECAVKTIRGDATRAQLDEFYQEVRIMALFDNPYVIKYFGTACLLTPVMVAMELLTGGSMWSLLRNDSSLSHQKLCEMSADIARGMKHLAQCQIIHRDLAARNCLLTGDHRVKISDFGLSLQATQVIVKQLKHAPIRWFSPETLAKGIFNEKTDVWSYGVVIWEIFSRCAHSPLHPKTMKEAAVIIKEVENPHKLPEENSMNATIAMCCKKNPADRPTFENLVVFWDGFFALGNKNADENKKKVVVKKKATLRNKKPGELSLVLPPGDLSLCEKED
ncbi:unnamed protein product [Caenorhabditis angaria]|uniref:Protein kinase domain-containing protein n=1 Tax=Caenorhabditis angaria TaxID=860376 RepID=A0A9P1IT54_9PELO|nr:unnamed protein product [Caenorhabditis angaria]